MVTVPVYPPRPICPLCSAPVDTIDHAPGQIVETVFGTYVVEGGDEIPLLAQEQIAIGRAFADLFSPADRWTLGPCGHVFRRLEVRRVDGQTLIGPGTPVSPISA